MHVWLPRFPTDRIARQSTRGKTDPLSPQNPVVVVAKVKGALVVEAVDENAHGQGLAPGLTLSEARAMVPHIKVETADPDADQRALEKIARGLERYTPFVGLDPPCGLFLDISGCAHLFGGEEAMLQDVLARLGCWGFSARAGVGDHPALAWALARFGDGGVLPRGEGVFALAHLPVDALRIDGETAAVLARLGLKTVENLLSQPRVPLVRRFGPDLARRMDQALGQQDEPITPLSPVEPFSVERRFAEPLVQMEGVQGCLKELSVRLAGALYRRGEGARKLTLRLFHSDGAVRETSVGTSAPLADPERIPKLLMPRVEALSARIEDESGIDLMRLGAVETGPLVSRQGDLCEGSEVLGDLAALIDTLSERLGVGAVQRFLPADTHQPAEADLRRPAQTTPLSEAWSEGNATDPWQEESTPLTLRRPIRLFCPPEPVLAIASVPDGPPVRFVWRRAHYHVVAAEGPERISANWWSGEADKTCDYFAVEDDEGRRFWLFREGLYGREPGEPRWFMHGLFP